jgi:hypothetical protein
MFGRDAGGSRQARVFLGSMLDFLAHFSPASYIKACLHFELPDNNKI